jgi:predicted PurR-regulated permease PerM
MARGLTGAGRNNLAQGSSIETTVAVSAVVAALYLGRAIAIPIAIAILISFSLGPAVSWIRHHGAGRLPAIAIVVAPALLALAAFAFVVTSEVGRLAQNIPSYQSNIQTKIDSLRKSLPSPNALDRGTSFLRDLGSGQSLDTAAPAHGGGWRPEIAPAPGKEAKPIQVEIQNPRPSPVDLLRSVMGPLVEPVSDAGLVLLFVIFFLAEKETLRDRLIRLAGVRDMHRTTMAMDEAGKRVSRYLLMQTLVNTVFGAIIAIALTILGLPNGALWGGVAAALRFIPYLGVAASAVLPLALAFAVDPGWSMLFWTAGLFIALELVIGNFIEPWLYGPTTGLSAVALIVSVIFWTWLWGTIGLLLATPLTVCIAVIGRYVPQLSFLDILLGNDAPLKPEESFYQRLLAGDPIEAASQAEDFIKAKSLPEFLAEVALPALILAEHDRSRGELDPEHMRRVARGVNTVVEQLRPGNASHPETAGSVEANGPDGAATETSELVVCVAGKTDLDHAAGALLARLLTEDGCAAVALPYDRAIRLSHPELEERRVRAVCLSYLDAEAAPQARYLTRRIRRQLGADRCLIVAFWGMEQDIARLEYAKGETRADRIVTTLPGALEAIEAAAAGRSDMEADQGQSLRDLARQASSAIERSA